MITGAKSKKISVFLAVSLIFFLTPGLTWAELNQSQGTGALQGKILALDGSTPFPGALVKLKHLSTGKIFESNLTNNQGYFKVEGLTKGLYLVGVSTPQGDFNANALVGVEPNKTEEIVVVLKPYDQQTAQAAREVYREQKKAGESLVGRVVAYYPPQTAADVFIIKGYLQLRDRVHVKGAETDFYQNVESLALEGKAIKRAYASQTVLMKLKYPAQVGDLVYLVCKEGILPIFLTPLGIAAIVAGSAAVIYGTVTLTDEPVVSSKFKK
jgi:hypothetical protein